MEMLHKKVQKRKVRITDIPLVLRPREKLFAQGAKNLTEVELLAILLVTGSTKQNALVLGEKLFKRFSLQKINDQLKEMVGYPGVGAAKAARITPKEIFSHALQSPCAALIVVHNHPSNDTNPSDDDIGFTKRIHETGEVMGIPLVDHVIVSKSGYFSFRGDKTLD